MNQGYDQAAIEEVKKAAQQQNNLFAWNEEEEQTEEYAHFFFVGKYNDREVVFDTFLYTLEMEYATRSFDVAMSLLLERFPEFEEADFDADEGEHIEQLEIIMMEVEEEGLARVKEFLEYDEEVGYGVSLNVCLQVAEINAGVIDDFIQKFNSGTFKLDPTEYDFELGNAEE